MGMFDSNALLTSTLEGSNAVRRPNLPQGETFGQITKVEIQPPKETGQSPRLNVELTVEDPSYLALAGRDKVVTYYSPFLDITPSGTIDMAPDKNFKLGRLREATGTNQPGKTLQDLMGQRIRFQVGHRPANDGSGDVYDDIQRVARM